MTDVATIDSEQPDLRVQSLKDRHGNQQDFRFLVIDGPEKWPTAKEVKRSYQMPILGQNKLLRFNLTGLSLADWERLEIEHKIPRWEDSGPATDEFLAGKAAVEAEKKVHAIEMATGVKFPGDTYAAKAKYLNQLNEGEASALYLFIQNDLCAFDSGSLLQRYISLCAEGASQVEDRVVDFTSFESWEAATKTGYIFRFHRPGEEYILEFPLKNISAESKLLIEAGTRDVEPPMVPKRDPNTKKWIPGELVPDYNDEGYLKRMRAMAQKRTVLFMEACLPFEIPGTDQMSKYAWLADRLVGDVFNLKKFIDDDLCGYSSRYSFFTTV